MQTDTIFAWQVEREDVILLADERTASVDGVDDQETVIHFAVTFDDDGETDTITLGADDPVEVVYSFE